MKIVFMGSPDFAIPSLQRIHETSHEVAAVVSGKDKRRGRGSGTSPTPVKAEAQDLGLPVIEVEDLGDPAFANRLQELEADLFVIVAFRILPPRVLEIPKKGSINLHASLLPKYRGAAPIHWAIINGEQETGCTIFWLDEHVDTGKIITQQSTGIGENETTGDVYNRLKTMGGRLLCDAINSIDNESYSTTEQDESEASGAPKLFTEDCKIDFRQPARDVHNKIRGLSPFPVAWAKLDGLKFNMYRSKIGPDKDLKPGELRLDQDDLLVGCKEGSVLLEKVQLQGKRKMDAKDFINGYSGTGMLH